VPNGTCAVRRGPRSIDGPGAEIWLFDQLVEGGEKPHRNDQAERLGNLTRETKIVPSHCFGNILRKKAQNTATNDSTGVELSRCKTLNDFAQLRELNFPIYVTASRSTNEFVDCRCADLTLDMLGAVQHRKPERHPLVIVTQYTAPRQRH
jgi:hypothetical protein